MDKKGKKGNVVSIILTILVIAIYLVPNFVSAVSVSVVTDKKAYTSQDDTITFNLRVDVQNNERIPIQNLNLDIKSETGKTFECKFTTSGEPVSKCSNIDITKVSVHSFSKGEGYGYGYGYGPGTGWGNISTYFGDGYGYGYGYGDQNIYPDELNYTITWNFKSASAEAGNYQATLQAYADDNNGKIFIYKTTSPAQFSITLETDVEAALKDLTNDKIKKDNIDLDNVVSNLNLITIGLKDTTIKWTSSNSTIINPFSGKVTRPTITGENKTVTLTAAISKTGQDSLSNTFTVIVLKEELSDASAVSQALDAITISNILLLNNNETNVTTNLNLGTTAKNGVTLSWSSNNPSVIEKTGSISRTSADTSVKLTVTATKGSATNSTSFTVAVKGTSDPNLIDLSKAKLALTDLLILNGNPAKDNVIANLNLPTSLSGYSGVVISWSSNNAAIAKNGTVIRSTTEDMGVTLTENLTKNTILMTKEFILTVKKKAARAEVVNNKVTVNSGETEIVVDITNVADLKTIQVPSDVADDEVVSLNLDTLRDNEGKLNLSTNNLTLSRNTSSGLSYDVLMPKGSIVTGSDKWNGIINLPTLKAISEVTPTAETGKTKTVDVVIEVGFTGGQLNFTKAAKLTIPNMWDKKAGYTDADNVFHSINPCSTTEKNAPDTLPEAGDCYISDGTDLIIWTKHFTKFVAYTETATTTTTPAAGGGGGGGGGGVGGYVPPRPTPIVAEEAKEEVPAEEVITIPTVAAPAVTPTGLATITGAVVGAAREAVKSIWSKIIGGVLILFVASYLLYVIVLRPGAPLQLARRDYNWYYNRAALLHRKADEAYREGKRKKSEKLFKKAQTYREKGEQKHK